MILFEVPSFRLLVLFISLIYCQLGDAQQLEVVDFKQITGDIELFPSEKKIVATAHYRFQLLKKTDSVYLDAKNIQLEQQSTSNSPIKIKQTVDKIWLIDSFKPGKEYQVSISYEAKPGQAMYFFEDQIWTQGQGKETSHWLPSIDDVNDKIIFNLHIKAPAQFTVLANGVCVQEEHINNETKLWSYQMKKPMSSYLLALVMGRFEKYSETSSSGIPLEYYINPEDKGNIAATYRHTREMFDFFETEIGVDYPWENYKQVPVRDFLYAGMENTSLTIFSEAFVVDSIGFVDRNYVNVNAHELAHQWFGNLVTAKSGEHHWLQEGFATFYALLAERKIFGDDYYYWKLYESAEQLISLSDEGKGEPLLKKGASSLTYYQKGAWALHILRERVGELIFRQAVQNYLTRHQFNSANTDDFLYEIEAITDDELDWFREDWLNQSAFKASQALNSLRKSPFIEQYLNLSAIAKRPLSEKQSIFNALLKPPVNDYLGQAVVFQLSEESVEHSSPLYLKAFESESILVRQAIALSLDKIPEHLKSNYESLLSDTSYVTQEAALYHLWLNFPEDRPKYLDATIDLVGFQDKNLRQLWLTLALATEGYQNHLKQDFFNELSSYAAPKYSFEIRQLAFQYLYSFDGFTNQNLMYLLDACVHPNWRFRSSSRELLSVLLKENEEVSAQLLSLRKELPTDQLQFLNTFLDK
ncbi:M1 family metallopeptidase [Planktosalinus lacus]|uniref:M1 family metallopeptidase n=1 Tax=Planktosalinus lacus TaxID=1526573 RepID=UPI001663BF72|nr:M1 family metallopeptidase [Planktosalinus lacus]